MTGTQVKRSIFVYNWKAIEISGRLAPQTLGFPWFRRLLASKCLSPRDSHTQLLEQTGPSCPTDIVSITFPPQQPPALPPNPHLATQSTPAHHGSYPVLFGPPLPEKSQPRTSHQSPGPPDPASSPGTLWQPAEQPTALPNKRNAQPGLATRLCWWRLGVSPGHPENSSRRLRHERVGAAEADGTGF